MAKQPVTVSIPEAVCANSAMIRSLLVHLIRVGALTPDELDTLFMLTRQELAGGRYDPETVEGAQTYLDCLHQSMGLSCVAPDSGMKH
jgi:hypothetical protein